MTGYAVEMVLDDPGADLLAPAGLDMPLSRLLIASDGEPARHIAHHLRLGRRDICAGLNPKRGFRAALSHGLGLPIPGGDRVKLLTGPVLAAPPHDCVPLRELRPRHPGIAPGPQRPLPEPVHP